MKFTDNNPVPLCSRDQVINRPEVLGEPQHFPHLPTTSRLPAGNFLSAQRARRGMETGQSAHPLLGGNVGLSLYE